MARRSSALSAWLVTMLVVPAALTAQSEITLADLGRCPLEGGAVIEDCRLSYATAGVLNADSSNAVLIVPWFSGTSQASLSLVGPGKLVDSSKYYVVAIGAFGDGISSSPSTSPSQAGGAFPRYTIRDMVAAQHRLVTEILGLHSLHAVTGISMGGMEVFQWMASYPDFPAKAVPIVGSPHVNGYDLLRWQTELELIDAFRECGCSAAGRLIALWETLVAQTPDRIASQVTPETFASFSAEIGERTFDPTDRASQIRAMMTHDIAARDESALDNMAASNAADWLIVVAEDDLSVSPAPALEFAQRIGAKTLVLSGGCGHLSFWCEAATLAAQVDAFLASNS